MMGKILVFGLLIASALLTGLASRTNSVRADTSTGPSATPEKRTKVAPDKPGTEKKPSGADLVRKKNQDIEVENDETHIVGSGGKSAAPANGSANRRSTPRNTRTETVDNNETITVHLGVIDPGDSGANTRVRKGTVRKSSHTRPVRRPAARKTAGKRVFK